MQRGSGAPEELSKGDDEGDWFVIDGGRTNPYEPDESPDDAGETLPAGAGIKLTSNEPPRSIQQDCLRLKHDDEAISRQHQQPNYHAELFGVRCEKRLYTVNFSSSGSGLRGRLREFDPV